MFSNLGPLFKATLRQAEQTDTRMEIRKDDPRDQGKRREGDQEENGDSDLWEDSMGVSIDALCLFLVNFVEGRTAHVVGALPQSGGQEANMPASPSMPEIRPPQNTQTARAVQAYQSMAEKNGTAYHAPPPPSFASDVDLVHAGDVRAIHILIADLGLLSAAGYETLPLEKADTFLHALQNAVERLKSGV